MAIQKSKYVQVLSFPATATCGVLLPTDTLVDNTAHAVKFELTDKQKKELEKYKQYKQIELLQSGTVYNSKQVACKEPQDVTIIVKAGTNNDGQPSAFVEFSKASGIQGLEELRKVQLATLISEVDEAETARFEKKATSMLKIFKTLPESMMLSLAENMTKAIETATKDLKTKFNKRSDAYDALLLVKKENSYETNRSEGKLRSLEIKGREAIRAGAFDEGDDKDALLAIYQDESKGPAARAGAKLSLRNLGFDETGKKYTEKQLSDMGIVIN